MRMQVSSVGDLTNLAKELEEVFKRHFPGKPAMAIAFTLAPDYDVTHWVTNVSRDNGIKLFRDTADKMIAQTN